MGLTLGILRSEDDKQLFGEEFSALMWMFASSLPVVAMGLILVYDGMNVVLAIVLCVALAFFMGCVLVPAVLPRGFNAEQRQRCINWSPVIFIVGAMAGLLILVVLALAIAEVTSGPAVLSRRVVPTQAGNR